MASTTRLLEGKEAGEPADRKHLRRGERGVTKIITTHLTVVHNNLLQYAIHLHGVCAVILPLNSIQCSVDGAAALCTSKPTTAWSVLLKVEQQRLLVVFHQVVVQPLAILGLHVGHTVPANVQESSGQLVNFVPSRNATRIQDLITLIIKT